MKNKKIIIAGGTGFMGTHLARYFGKENQVIVLTRNPAILKQKNRLHEPAPEDLLKITYWRWDGRMVEKHWASELEGCDLLINLSGKSVNCRYHEASRREIIDSRVLSTQTLGEAIRNCIHPPKCWINAASATIYRHSTDEPNNEYSGQISEWKKDNMPYSFFDRLRTRARQFRIAVRYGKESPAFRETERDFSVQVCRLWEESFFGVRTPFTRKIALRTAIVLGDGGALKPYRNLVKFGLGGRQGNGEQHMSWVHIEDVARSIEWLFEKPEAEGIFNVSAPEAPTNRLFMQILRKRLGVSFGLPACNALLEAGAFLVGTETELILKSRWVYPARLLQSGFLFQYPSLEMALHNLLPDAKPGLLRFAPKISG